MPRSKSSSNLSVVNHFPQFRAPTPPQPRSPNRTRFMKTNQILSPHSPSSSI
jgi:hypothetical protein